MAKKKLSKSWLHDHLNDPYVRLAQQHGYRARAAFKLIEILDAERLLKRGDVVVDLGATPGSWSQVARERLVGSAGVLHGRVVALDLLPMEPIAGVEFLQGDFRDDAVLAQLQALLGANTGANPGANPSAAPGARVVDLVLSDMAPNLSGVGPADAARIAHVCELALEFASAHLRPDGALVVKAFHGSGFSQIVEAFKRRFKRVVEKKPRASRDKSAETFLLGRGLKQLE